jgi:putative ubiquitin-RnfH superfamily antitoxin RatB of RatAB toxin-antitoxin module
MRVARLGSSKIVIEVVYALPERQVLRRLVLPEGSTVEDVIRASGLRAEFPEIDPARVGIHGKRVPVGAILRDQERVEIYRPLRADPKEVRRMRAAKERAKK